MLCSLALHRGISTRGALIIVKANRPILATFYIPNIFVETLKLSCVSMNNCFVSFYCVVLILYEFCIPCMINNTSTHTHAHIKPHPLSVECLKESNHYEGRNQLKDQRVQSVANPSAMVSVRNKLYRL